jgi:hypothetical protein
MCVLYEEKILFTWLSGGLLLRVESGEVFDVDGSHRLSLSPSWFCVYKNIIRIHLTVKAVCEKVVTYAVRVDAGVL